VGPEHAGRPAQAVSARWQRVSDSAAVPGSRVAALADFPLPGGRPPHECDICTSGQKYTWDIPPVYLASTRTAVPGITDLAEHQERRVLGKIPRSARHLLIQVRCKHAGPGSRPDARRT
jgi:hypothetical protein